jgi:hypothetical protein
MATVRRVAARLPAQKRDAIRRQFTRANRDLAWLADHYADVRKRHAGRFVVVWNAGIVATGKTLESATHAARRKDVPVDDALLQYVPSKGETFVF